MTRWFFPVGLFHQHHTHKPIRYFIFISIHPFCFCCTTPKLSKDVVVVVEWRGLLVPPPLDCDSDPLQPDSGPDTVWGRSYIGTRGRESLLRWTPNGGFCIWSGLAATIECWCGTKSTPSRCGFGTNPMLPALLIAKSTLGSGHLASPSPATRARHDATNTIPTSTGGNPNNNVVAIFIGSGSYSRTFEGFFFLFYFGETDLKEGE